MWALGLLVLAVFSGSAVAQGTKCMTQADCAQDECCFKHTGPYLVSKRQDLPLLSQSIDSVTGICEKYKSEGDYCSWLDTANGHCGCGTGLSCSYVAPTLQTVAPIQMVSKRALPPRFGTTHCVQDANHIVQ